MVSITKLTSFAFFKELTLLPFIEQIILYGSRSRQDNRERSDIDLAISCPHADARDWLKILEIIDHADTLIKIDSVRLDHLSADNPLRRSIENEGTILFESKGQT